MQYFHYERSPKSLAIQYSIGYIICISCFLFGGLYLVLKDIGTMSFIMGTIFLVGSILAIPKSIWHYLKIDQANQSWKITVTDEKITWNAPTNLGRFNHEESFCINIKEISKVSTILSKNESGGTSYYILRKNSTDIQLNPQSGVSMTKLFNAFRKLGIATETTYEEN